MKTPQQLLADVERRLARSWAACLTGDAGAWPHAFALGRPSSAALAADFTATVEVVGAWRAWQARHGLPVSYQERRVLGTGQQLPTHAVIPDVDTAAGLCGDPWPARIARGRQRADVLAQRYAHLTRPDRTLAAVDSMTDVDFTLLCRAADWFAQHDATGLTPRQVPIAGLHAKWLNTRQALVRELADIDALGLLPDHPARIHLTYLDPGHRAAGARRHDCATVGDLMPLPYRPLVVVISENKDTAIHFPPVPGGVSVEGMGRGGGTAAAFDWITQAPRVIYWGDMDADGLEILDGFRAAGVPATSMLMDLEAYDEWEPFGTDVDKAGKQLAAHAPRAVPHLTDAERALYDGLTSPSWTRHRRIEQERIPLSVALRHVLPTLNP